jgi:hypothetical protein
MKTRFTVNDIKDFVLLINKENDQSVNFNMKRIFDEYDRVEEITVIKSNLENFKEGKYEFGDDGELNYGVKIPETIVDLPFINDYLTQDYGFISKTMGSHKEIYVAQYAGACISINFSHDSKSWFIYDQETRKPVIEKKLPWHDNTYIGALLEEYQTDKGVFNDIVIIDSYCGSYCKHFQRPEEVTLENYKEIIKQYEDKHLNNEEE